jgi:hypothetical protein
MLKHILFVFLLLPVSVLPLLCFLFCFYCCWQCLKVAVLWTVDSGVVMVLLMNKATVHKELLLSAEDSFSLSLCTFLFYSFSSPMSLFLSSPSFFLSLVLSKSPQCPLKNSTTNHPMCFFFSSSPTCPLFSNISLYFCPPFLFCSSF